MATIPAGATTRDDPDELFTCAKLSATIRRGVCVARQQARHMRNAPVHPMCADGKCGQGKLVALGLSHWKPEPYSGIRKDWREQRLARTRLRF